LLPVYPAFVAWVVLTQFMMLLAFLLLLRARPNPQAGRFVLPLAAGLIVFRATLVTLHNGQLSGLLLLIVSAIAFLWERQKWWQGALLLPILALKPNLGVPIILFLSLYLLGRRQLRALFTGAGAGLLLLAIGWVQDPRWIAEFWNAGNTKLSQIFGFAPTLWGISAYLCNHSQPCSMGYGAAGVLLLLGMLAWLAWSVRNILTPLPVAALAVTATLLLTPTAWPYDQLLLVIPIVAATLSLANGSYPFLLIALLFVGMDIMSWLLLGVSASIQSEIWNVALPLTAFALSAWSLLVEKRAEQAAGPAGDAASGRANDTNVQPAPS
jgi:hypothetical protein